MLPVRILAGDLLFLLIFLFLCSTLYTVTCIPIARQRLCKHIPGQANARNIRTSIAR
jgi:hypothetical protein